LIGLGLAFLFGLICWVLGPSFDGESSYIGNELLKLGGSRWFFGGTGLVAISLFYIFTNRKQSCFFQLAFVGSLVALLLIANRASYLAVSVWIILVPLFLPSTFMIKFLTSLFGLGLIISVSFYSPLFDRFRGIWTVGSGLERINLWRIAWDLSQSNPILGVGPGQFSTLVQGLDASISEPLDVHNSFLEVLCETGWPGFLLFICFWAGLAIAAALSIVRHKPILEESNRWKKLIKYLDQSWEERATFGFILVYFVVGFFGSRHNLPFSYILAGIGYSKIISMGRAKP
jgi:O-antigen ligase